MSQYEAAIANTAIQNLNSDGGVFTPKCFETQTSRNIKQMDQKQCLR